MIWKTALWTSVGAFVILAVGYSMAWGQEPRHPKTGEVHWYDRICCSNRDCRPLEEGEFRVKNGEWQLRNLQYPKCDWTSLGGSWRVKVSKDFDMHGCFDLVNDNPCRALCIYVGGGV